MSSLLKQRCLRRWYALKDHPIQLKLINDTYRFKIACAGRRSGKTERAKRYLVKQCMQNPGVRLFAGSPTRMQSKQIWWDDLKLLSFSCLYSQKPSETELIIYFPNSSELHVIGFDEPRRFDGQPWDGGVIDEIADIKQHAWAQNISPALDTVNPLKPFQRPWCWLIGVPDGLNHYYELSEYAKLSNDPEWKFYTWFSSDILPSDVINSAKRRLSAKQFRQEYEASFETAQGRIYEDYSHHNYSEIKLDGNEVLWWMHDFNYTPLSSVIGVCLKNSLYLIDEIILESAVSRQSALEFVERYKYHKNKKVIIYGDPSGKAGEKHGHSSDYVEIEKVLKDSGWQYERKVKTRAPSIKDRQNAVRAKIKNAAGEISLFVNTKKCIYTHKGLHTVQMKPGSTFLEKDSPYQHVTTAIGYCIEYKWPSIIKNEVNIKPIVSKLNYW